LILFHFFALKFKVKFGKGYFSIFNKAVLVPSCCVCGFILYALVLYGNVFLILGEEWGVKKPRYGSM